jgi:hypothetical protein
MAALERTMKIQEVILRALAKKIAWWQAAEIIRMTGSWGDGAGAQQGVRIRPFGGHSVGGAALVG